MSDELKAVAYTGNDDDEVVVAFVEYRSMWDEVASMMASELTVGEVDALVNEIKHLRALITAWADAEDAEAADEIERLRALITAWADADDAAWPHDYYPTMKACEQARVALRKAVGR